MTLSAIEIPPGSRLWIDLPFCRHHGTYLGDGFVVHNSKQKGRVCIEPIEGFSGGKAPKHAAPKEPMDPNRLRAKAVAQVGKRYSLLNFNCEHLARGLSDGKATSKQVGYALGGAGVGVLVAMSKELNLRQSLAMAGLFGLGGLLLANLLEG